MTLSRRTVLASAGGLILAGPARAQAAVIPFDIVERRMVVAASVNGQAVRAIVDSGSTVYGLDASTAARIGIEPKGRRQTLRGLNGVLRGRIAEDARLSLAGKDLGPVPMLVFDYTPLIGPVGYAVEAALGEAFFRRFAVEFDFTAATMTLHEPAAFTPPEGARLTKLWPENGLMTAPLVFDQRRAIGALIDTGSATPLIVSPAPARRMGLLQGRVSTVPQGSLAGASIAKITSAEALTFGGERFTGVPMQVPAQDLGFDANVGLDLLSRFHLWLDFKGERMWTAAPDTARPFRRDLLGFYGVVEDSHIRVTHVSASSPAAAAGFRVGEIVTAINGQSADIANPALRDAAEGTALTFAIAGGQTRRLTLARYY